MFYVILLSCIISSSEQAKWPCIVTSQPYIRQTSARLWSPFHCLHTECHDKKRIAKKLIFNGLYKASLRAGVNKAVGKMRTLTLDCCYQSRY